MADASTNEAATPKGADAIPAGVSSVPGPAPAELYVLYDATCGICDGFRQWLSKQKPRVPLHLVPYQDPSVAELFPEISGFDVQEQMLVVDDQRRVYQGPAAWVMCLWGTKRYRGLSHRMSTPALFPVVRKVCLMISANRLRLSALLGMAPTPLVESVADEPEMTCNGSACELPHAPPRQK